MRAFILAGGLGTRLSSIVSDRPKPLAMVGRKPFLEHQIELLKTYNTTDIVLCVGYRGWQIRDYFGAGQRWGVEIRYSEEDRPLGTAGALKNAERLASDTFLVLNGDTFIDIDIEHLVRIHQNHRLHDESCRGTIALTTVPDRREFGSVCVAANNQIASFEEKRDDGNGECLVNAGVYVFERDMLESVSVGKKTSLEYETLPALLAHGLHLYGYFTEGFFVDIGDPRGFRTFQRYVERHCNAHSM